MTTYRVLTFRADAWHPEGVIAAHSADAVPVRGSKRTTSSRRWSRDSICASTIPSGGQDTPAR